VDVVYWLGFGVPLRRGRFDSGRPRQPSPPGWQMRSLRRAENAQESARYGPRAPIRGQHKGAGDPCKIAAVGALPTVSTIFIPSRPTAGRPAVNRSIVVRVHAGEPIRGGAEALSFEHDLVRKVCNFSGSCFSGQDTSFSARMTGVRISVAAPLRYALSTPRPAVTAPCLGRAPRRYSWFHPVARAAGACHASPGKRA
jgi:hypothetical protein